MVSVFVVAYIDEMLIDSKIYAYHLHNFNRVLSIFRNAKLYANLGNYEFCVENYTFLGYVVSFQGFQVGAIMVPAIKDWFTSKSAFEGRSFHGFPSIYKKFIKDFHTIASLLVEVPKKMTGFIWKISYYSPTLYSSLEVDYGFKLLISLDLISYSIDHALSLGKKKMTEFMHVWHVFIEETNTNEHFEDKGQASKFLIIYVVNNDYSRKQLGCKK
ncbi:hypothetical protein M9H77_03074 [Catharanthus roseus]|uniref:Uncharacterized protein n=1 Tax=Catharanthus roseus TaxID=4058 RepID=A0ACC0CA87_CATRO|nr:hypothetical protein M9H77_03074 [Catharanthus roseus]